MQRKVVSPRVRPRILRRVKPLFFWSWRMARRNWRRRMGRFWINLMFFYLLPPIDCRIYWMMLIRNGELAASTLAVVRRPEEKTGSQVFSVVAAMVVSGSWLSRLIRLIFTGT